MHRMSFLTYEYSNCCFSFQRLVQNRRVDDVHPAEAVEKPGTLESVVTPAE